VKCLLLQPVWIQGASSGVWAAVSGSSQLQDSIDDTQHHQRQLCQQQTINSMDTR